MATATSCGENGNRGATCGTTVRRSAPATWYREHRHGWRADGSRIMAGIVTRCFVIMLSSLIALRTLAFRCLYRCAGLTASGI
jgi:hypothetical protein